LIDLNKPTVLRF